MHDQFGLLIPRQHAQSARRVWTLRLLGRLEFMTTAMLHLLVYQDRCGKSAMYAELNKLIAEGLIWRTKAPAHVRTIPDRTRSIAPPLAPPNVFGLTDKGRETLIELDAEEHARWYEILRSRDPRGRPPSVLTMEHDLQVSWFCANILRSAHLSRYIRGVHVEVEYVIHKDQRVDALIVLRIGSTMVSERHRSIPLLANRPRADDEIDIYLGLEVDKNTESLRVIAEKAVAYRTFTNQGTYQKALGGFLLPVFLVPTGQRAGKISLAWRKAWPNGLGIVATPHSASDRSLGVLWGTYLTLHAPEQPIEGLLNGISLQEGRFVLHPIISRQQWQNDKGLIASTDQRRNEDTMTQD